MPFYYSPLYNFSFKENCPPQRIVLHPDTYFFEGWGASGGGNLGGSGGYTAGVLHLEEETTFYVVVGGEGGKVSTTGESVPGGCNGGGDGGAPARKLDSSEYYASGSGGGGATDIRFNESTQYTSRILVAGGGGGSCANSTRGFGGDAGGIIGFNSTGDYNISQGGLQNGEEFRFGEGENGRNGTTYKYVQGAEGNGGGGGGWYGGYSYQGEGDYSNAGGGGGSSYISGHCECKPHSSLVFIHTIIKSGRDSFLSPNGTMVEGHRGNGFFRISLLVNFPSRKLLPIYSLSFLSHVIFLGYKSH